MRKIGIDIDGTVTCTHALTPHINEAFNVELTTEDFVAYDLTKAFDVDPDEFSAWWKANELRIYEASPVHTTAQSVLQRWNDQFELHYISARPEATYATTKRWFQRHDIPFDAIHLIGSHYKVNEAKRLDVDLFLEDKYDNAIDLNETLGIPVLLFDAPWNRKPLPEGVTRVYNWTEANEWIRTKRLQ